MVAMEMKLLLIVLKEKDLLPFEHNLFVDPLFVFTPALPDPPLDVYSFTNTDY